MAYSRSGVAFLIGLALAGAGAFWWHSPTEAAKRAVRDSLKDPESGVFSDLSTCRGPGNDLAHVAGYVNARNSFGAMTGKKMFVVSFYDDGSNGVRIDDEDEGVVTGYFANYRRLADAADSPCYNWPLEAFSAYDDELPVDPAAVN